MVPETGESVVGISAEQLVAPLARQRDARVLAGGSCEGVAATSAGSEIGASRCQVRRAHRSSKSAARAHLVVLRAEEAADPATPRQTVGNADVEPGGEGVHRIVAPKLAHLRDDEAAVQAAREQHADRRTRHERGPDGLTHAVTHRFDCVAAHHVPRGSGSGGIQ